MADDVTTIPKARADAAGEAQAPLRIVLVGWFGVGNFGNDGSCEAVLGAIRKLRPDARISCVCNDDTKQVSERLGLPVVQLRLRPRGLMKLLDVLLLRFPFELANWINSLRTLARADLLLFPGTGIFDDYRTSPLGSPMQTFRWCAAARLAGAKLAFVSVGAGPIVHPVSRWLLGSAAKLAAHRSYRDEKSRAFMQSIGVDDAQSAVLPDVAFLLPTPPHEDRPAGAPLTVGVGLMSYAGWSKDAAIYEHYVSTVADFMQWLAGRGHRIRLLAGEESDWRAVRTLRERLSPEAAAALDSPSEMHSLEDVMRELAGIDMVVATRFHVVLSALKLGRPTISLSYNVKNDQLLAAMGLDGFFQHADKIDFQRLIADFEKLEAGRLAYAATIRARVAEHKARLLEPDVLLPPALFERR